MDVDYNDKDYNYKSYWSDRSYEHNAEVVALKKLLPPHGGRIIDIGAGFGRLYPVYKDRFKEVVLLEPSSKLTKGFQVQPSTNIVNASLVEISRGNNKIHRTNRTYDCAIMVRVAHHLTDLDEAFLQVNRLLVPGGVFVLEFANKVHFLNVLKHTIRLDFSFFLAPMTSIATKGVTFNTWHPNYVQKILGKSGFKVIEKLSVSNFRNPFVKKIVPEGVLLFFEHFLQKPLVAIYFGPSIFIKATKVGDG